eukprot:TCONS_00016878-protein
MIGGITRTMLRVIILMTVVDIIFSSDTESLLKSLCDEAEKDAQPFAMLGVTFDKSKHCTCAQSPDVCTELENPPFDFIATCKKLILAGIPDDMKQFVECECNTFKNSCAWFEKLNADSAGGGDGGEGSTNVKISPSTSTINNLPTTSRTEIEPSSSAVEPPKPSPSPDIKPSIDPTPSETTTPTPTSTATPTTQPPSVGDNNKNTNNAVNVNINKLTILMISFGTMVSLMNLIN